MSASLIAQKTITRDFAHNEEDVVEEESNYERQRIHPFSEGAD
jgi:hypothetical protein